MEKVGSNTSVMLILNMGAPQVCVLSPLLYNSNTIIKFADDTTVLGLITINDETAYREEVRALAEWGQDNNISFNVSKTKELIVVYRKWRAEHAPIHIDGAEVERGESFEFFGIHITKDLSWSKHINTVVNSRLLFDCSFLPVPKLHQIKLY